MHNERYSLTLGGRNNLSRPWIFNDAWSGLSRTTKIDTLCPALVPIFYGGGARFWGSRICGSSMKKLLRSLIPLNFFYANQLSLYSINSKNRKSLLQKIFFFGVLRVGKQASVFVRWSTFYISEIFVYSYIRRYRLLVCYVLKYPMVFVATLSCRGWRSSFVQLRWCVMDIGRRLRGEVQAFKFFQKLFCGIDNCCQQNCWSHFSINFFIADITPCSWVSENFFLKKHLSIRSWEWSHGQRTIPNFSWSDENQQFSRTNAHRFVSSPCACFNPSRT